MNIITAVPSQPGSDKKVHKIDAPVSFLKHAANVKMRLPDTELSVVVAIPKSVMCVRGEQYYVAHWWAKPRGYVKTLPKAELLP